MKKFESVLKECVFREKSKVTLAELSVKNAYGSTENFSGSLESRWEHFPNRILLLNWKTMQSRGILGGILRVTAGRII